MWEKYSVGGILVFYGFVGIFFSYVLERREEVWLRVFRVKVVLG